MILGVDHIALSAEEIDGAVRELEELGFSPKFSDVAVPNHRAKQPFLRRFEAAHAVAYCSSRASGVAIEITVHGSLRAEDAGPGYGVLLAGLSQDGKAMGSKVLEHPLGAWWHRVGKGSAREIRSRHLGTTWWVEVPPGPCAEVGTHVEAVMVCVNELERSRAFWTDGLGLAEGRGVVDQPRSRLLRPSTPLPQWAVDVFLIETGGSESERWYLDDPGFPCVAFLTTDIDNDRARLRHHGAAEVGEVFNVQVAGLALEVCFLRGPSGEPVELIQARGRRGATGKTQHGRAHGAGE